MAALRRLAAGAEGSEDGMNAYGTFYRVEERLVGPGGRTVAVVAVWLRWASDGTFHFVTLKPRKVPRS